MLSRNRISFVILATLLTAGNALAQYGQVNGNSNANEGQRQGYQQRPMTAEERAAYERAAAQSAQQQQAAQQAYAQQQQPQAPRMPEGFPITPQHEEYLGQILDHWERQTSQVSKFKCNFRRFAYDPGIVGYRDRDTNQLAAHRIAFGEIRFAAPDRAKYEATAAVKFKAPPKQPGAQAEYERVKEDSALERWICDGKAIFEFDFQNKRLYETPIPPNMQGNIIESPLPFLFGAKKKEILERYWVRTATPKGVENEYWLEAFPKRISDARLYSKIEIILAREDFLPKAMHMYTPQYNPKKGNEESYYFLFEKREVNNQLAKMADFMGIFVSPKKPAGWDKVVNKPATNNQARVPGIAPQGGAPQERR